MPLRTWRTRSQHQKETYPRNRPPSVAKVLRGPQLGKPLGVCPGAPSHTPVPLDPAGSAKIKLLRGSLLPVPNRAPLRARGCGRRRHLQGSKASRPRPLLGPLPPP